MTYNVSVCCACRDDPWTAWPDGVGADYGSGSGDTPGLSFEPNGDA